MTPLAWRPLAVVDFGRLREVRLQAHYAVQWLARAARAYVPMRPNDGHTNLGWDNERAALVTHALNNGSRLALMLGDLSLALLEGRSPRPVVNFALNGHTDAQVRAWLGGALKEGGLDAEALDASSPYAMPAHAIARGARYDTDAADETLAQLALWYANADAMLGQMRQSLLVRRLAAPPVRCWPHHFDLDTLVTFGAGEGARSMGAGFLPGDDYYNEPYFYVSLYPGPDLATLPPLPSIGHWHAKDFTRAIVPASKIVVARDQAREIEVALQAAIETAIKHLT